MDIFKTEFYSIFIFYFFLKFYFINDKIENYTHFKKCKKKVPSELK